MRNLLILLVPKERLELSRAKGPLDFESSASASSTTPAKKWKPIIMKTL